MMHFKCWKTITEHRLLYLTKLSFITEGEITTFHDKKSKEIYEH
jgi:hypothetical protein